MASARKKLIGTTEASSIASGFEIDRAKLVEALATVAPALTSSGLIDTFRYVWFAKDHIHAFGGALGIRLDFETGMEFGVPGGPLRELIAEGPDKVSLKLSGNELSVKLGRSNVKLATREPSFDIWRFPDEVEARFELVLTEEVLAALKTVLSLRPKSPTRTEHQGVCVFPSGGAWSGLTLYTTDSLSIVEVLMPDVEVPAGFEKLVLPRAFIENVVSLCKHGGKLKFTDNNIVAEGPGLKLYTVVLDAENILDLPSIVAGIVPPGNEGYPVPEGLAEVLRRAAIIAGMEASKEAKVIVKQAGGQLSVNGSYSGGSVAESFDYDGEGMDVEEVEAPFLGRQIAPPIAVAERMIVTKRALICYKGDTTYLVGTFGE